MVFRPFLAPRFDLAALTDEKAAELPRGHIPALDAIRGLAIVVVTLYRFGGGGEGRRSAIGQSGWSNWAAGALIYFSCCRVS